MKNYVVLGMLSFIFIYVEELKSAEYSIGVYHSKIVVFYPAQKNNEPYKEGERRLGKKNIELLEKYYKDSPIVLTKPYGIIRTTCLVAPLRLTYTSLDREDSIHSKLKAKIDLRNKFEAQKEWHGEIDALEAWGKLSSSITQEEELSEEISNFFIEALSFRCRGETVKIKISNGFLYDKKCQKIYIQCNPLVYEKFIFDDETATQVKQWKISHDMDDMFVQASSFSMEKVVETLKTIELREAFNLKKLIGISVLLGVIGVSFLRMNTISDV